MVAEIADRVVVMYSGRKVEEADVHELYADPRHLQSELDFACLFITRDLSTVEYLCDRVMVMYLGRTMEAGTREQVFSKPTHPYTQALLSAAPVPDPVEQRSRQRVVLGADLPSPADPPSGCLFRTRCPIAAQALPRAEEERPELRDVGGGHVAACHLIGPHGEPPSVETTGRFSRVGARAASAS